MNKVVHSSESVMWETPQSLFYQLNNVHKFNTDSCAIKSNAKCKHFYSPDQDGLIQQWRGSVWMNPPYGRSITGKWVEKAFNEMKNGVKTVALLPARTDTKWFRNFIYKKKGVTIEFIKGRVRFGGSKDGAPFPSMIVIFGAKSHQ